MPRGRGRRRRGGQGAEGGRDVQVAVEHEAGGIDRPTGKLAALVGDRCGEVGCREGVAHVAVELERSVQVAAFAGGERDAAAAVVDAYGRKGEVGRDVLALRSHGLPTLEGVMGSGDYLGDVGRPLQPVAVAAQEAGGRPADFALALDAVGHGVGAVILDAVGDDDGPLAAVGQQAHAPRAEGHLPVVAEGDVVHIVGTVEAKGAFKIGAHPGIARFGSHAAQVGQGLVAQVGVAVVVGGTFERFERGGRLFPGRGEPLDFGLAGVHHGLGQQAVVFVLREAAREDALVVGVAIVDGRAVDVLDIESSQFDGAKFCFTLDVAHGCGFKALMISFSSLLAAMS